MVILHAHARRRALLVDNQKCFFGERFPLDSISFFGIHPHHLRPQASIAPIHVCWPSA